MALRSLCLFFVYGISTQIIQFYFGNMYLLIIYSFLGLLFLYNSAIPITKLITAHFKGKIKHSKERGIVFTNIACLLILIVFFLTY